MSEGPLQRLVRVRRGGVHCVYVCVLDFAWKNLREIPFDAKMDANMATVDFLHRRL